MSGKDYNKLFNEVFGSTNTSTTTSQGPQVPTTEPPPVPVPQTQPPPLTNAQTPKRTPSVKGKLQPNPLFQIYDDDDTNRKPTVPKTKTITTPENIITRDDQTGRRESTSRPSSRGGNTQTYISRDHPYSRPKSREDDKKETTEYPRYTEDDLLDEYKDTPTPEKQVNPTQANENWQLSAETPFVWESNRETKVSGTGSVSWILIEPSWCADAQGGGYFTTLPITRQFERDLAKEKVIAHVNSKINQGLIPAGVKYILITERGYHLNETDSRETVQHWTLTFLNGGKTRLNYEGRNGNDIYHVRLAPKQYWAELSDSLQAKIDSREVYGNAQANIKKHLQEMRAESGM